MPEALYISAVPGECVHAFITRLSQRRAKRGHTGHKAHVRRVVVRNSCLTLYISAAPLLPVSVFIVYAYISLLIPGECVVGVVSRGAVRERIGVDARTVYTT